MHSLWSYIIVSILIYRMDFNTNKQSECFDAAPDTVSIRDDFELHTPCIDDIPMLRRYFSDLSSRSCDYTVGGLLMWTEYYDYKIATSEGHVFIIGRNPENGILLFYSPDDSSLEETENFASAYMRDFGGKGDVLCASFTDADNYLSPNSPSDANTESMKEYLYDIDRFITFGGRKMEKKRNHLNFFNRNYENITVRPITTDMRGDLIGFTIAFSKAHEPDSAAEYELQQTVNVLADWDKYPFFGIALYAGEEIIGYAFGEIVGDTFFEHVEKGNTDYRGVYQKLASSICTAAKERNGNLAYLNREEDMGIEELRQSKQSYHPTHYIEKTLTPAE